MARSTGHRHAVSHGDQLGEIRYGVAALPAGRRKDRLARAFERSIVSLFGPRVLAFDGAAAQAYALIRVRAGAAGKAIAVADGHNAAIAAAHGFAVATRDSGPFEAAGVPVIDPWRAG